MLYWPDMHMHRKQDHVRVAFRLAGERPVAMLRPLPVTRELEGGRRRHLLDVFEERRARKRKVVEISSHQRERRNGPIRAPAVLARRQDRFDLRGKQDRIAVAIQVERLLSETIAGADQHLVAGVPDQKRPHAVETANAAFAPFKIRVQEDFRVAGRAELVAAALELFAKLDVVVDLTIEHHGDSAIGARHRLMSGLREVENREALEAEADRSVVEHAIAVRAAMPDRVHHPNDSFGIGGCAIQADRCDDSAPGEGSDLLEARDCECRRMVALDRSQVP